MADGKIDVVLEDWQNLGSVPAVHEERSRSSTSAANGVTGVIGWYIPRYLLKQYPQFKTWKGLKGKESIFKSPGVGLAGDVPRRRPVLRAEGRALIKGLGLELQARRRGRRAGAGRPLEPALQAEEARPLLLVRPAVPERAVRPRPGQAAAAHARAARTTRRRAATRSSTRARTRRTRSTRSSAAKFAKSGSPAVGVVKKFKWTAEGSEHRREPDRRQEDEDPDKAAEEWVEANPGKVNAWLEVTARAGRGARCAPPCRRRLRARSCPPVALATP